jgi:hypothetical protein
VTKKKKGLTIEKLSTDRYDVEYTGRKGSDYTAEIIFRDGKFEKCEYDGASDTCDLEDWHFIELLSKEISKLVKKYK